jgi:hypothetical protein
MLGIALTLMAEQLHRDNRRYRTGGRRTLILEIARYYLLYVCVYVCRIVIIKCVYIYNKGEFVLLYN